MILWLTVSKWLESRTVCYWVFSWKCGWIFSWLCSWIFSCKCFWNCGWICILVFINWKCGWIFTAKSLPLKDRGVSSKWLDPSVCPPGGGFFFFPIRRFFSELSHFWITIFWGKDVKNL